MEFLKNPSKFSSLGGKLPKGLLNDYNFVSKNHITINIHLKLKVYYLWDHRELVKHF